MTRVIGPPKSRRRRWTLLWCLAIAIGVAMFYIGGASGRSSALPPYAGGVQDTGLFQLDGDTTGTPLAGTPFGALAAATTASATSISVTTTTVLAAPTTIEIGAERLNVTAVSGASPNFTYTVTRGFGGSTAAGHAVGAPVIRLTPAPQQACGPPDDWAALFNTGHINGDQPACSSNGFVFINDKIGAAGDNTYWSQGGSKDANDPAGGPWLWAPNDVAPDKNDLVNAFAASYTVPATASNAEAKLLMFGSDRYTTNGDAQQGFQFLQAQTCLQGNPAATPPISAGGTAACPDGTGGTTATPQHPTGCSPAFSGANNIGMFVDPVSGCPIHHKNGDILILVNFNNGGTLGLAAVYVWFGADGLGAGCYGDGTTCSNPAVQGNGANCATVTDPNKFCSISNTYPISNEPVWGYSAKSAKGAAIPSYDTSAFIEGGVDLSTIQGAGQCFPSFLAETRSSAGPSSGLGLTAQLKDLAFGKFQLCGSKIETTPSTSNTDTSTYPPTSTIPAAGIQIPAGSTNVTVYDYAKLTVTGASSFGGTVSFHLCGPTPLTDANYTLCTTGGVAVAVGSGSVGPPSPITLVTAATTLSEVGRYCWRADYSGDPTIGLGGASDSSVNECFKVTQRQATLSTKAVDASGNPMKDAQGNLIAVNLGSPIYDTGTIGNTAYQRSTNGPTGSDGSINASTRPTPAQGTITFKLYGPDSAGSTTNCNTLAAGFAAQYPNGIVVNVNGDGTYGGTPSTVTFTPTSAKGDLPGIYHWKATYSGDTDTSGTSGAPNTTGSGEHNSACGNTDEDVLIRQLNTSTVTTPGDGSGVALTGPVIKGSSVTDTAVVTDTSSTTDRPTGSVSFYICDPSHVTGTGSAAHCATADEVGNNGTGTLVNTVGPPLTDGAAANKATATSNSVTADTVGVWCFRAVYTPDTTLFIGSGDNSNSECFTVLDVTISTAQTFTVKDKATVTPVGTGATVGGHVRFRLYPNADCNASENDATLVDQTVAIGPSTAPTASTAETTPVSITTSQTTLSWLVEYTADNGGTAKNVSSSCHTENASLTINNG